MFLLLLPMSIILCSFTNMNNSDISGYYKSVGEDSTITVNNKNYGKGDTFNIDLGRRNWPIGEYMRLTIIQLKNYSKPNGDAYILSHGQMAQVDSISQEKISYSYSLSTDYSFSFTKTITKDISNSISAAVDIHGFGQISDESKISNQESLSETFSYSFGTIETKTVEYQLNTSSIPDGYEFASCVIASAQLFEFNYTIYDHYWWGDYVSKSDSDVNVSNSVLIYSNESSAITLCIRSGNDDSEPAYYLK